MANSCRVGAVTAVVTEQQALSWSDTLCMSVLDTGQGSSKSSLHLVLQGSPFYSRNIKAFRNLTLRTVPKPAMFEALKLYCKISFEKGVQDSGHSKGGEHVLKGQWF